MSAYNSVCMTIYLSGQDLRLAETNPPLPVQETRYTDPRPIIGRPNYGQRREIKEPCKYFANGGCARGDKCWFSHDPQV